ncbi:MAG: hypothetical protein M1838_004784 [Thelocarpon superellum]|nr:MAG: hypothetical protein M1838_004784 [Thelocarpon superellum]
MDTFSDWENQIVPRSFIPGFIVLSYVVSYLGAWTTLELLHKRTSGRGLYNWFLLTGSSITMGSVAIWCMHFIGNRAIVLDADQPQLQIAYSSTSTAVSFFVPILVIFTAFMTVGSYERVGKVRVTIGGTLAGLAICGMHYVGETGIDNYTCVYDVANIVASALIAITASITTLTIFFVLRAAWTNSWWKRALCAFLLAGTVSGMHWIASSGTQYRFRHVNTSGDGNISRDQVVVVVIVLSVAACAILFSYAVVAQRRRLRSASRNKQVVLACATFDPDGRLLVTPEGLLPSQKITNSYIERGARQSFEDHFSISHPVFLWIFRASRNWYGILDLLVGMRAHLDSNTFRKPAPPPPHPNAEETDPSEDYSVVFRELFCVAAWELADQIDEPLENLGVLYDEIMMTGTTAKSKQRRWGCLSSARPSPVHDAEAGLRDHVIHGRGQVLFVVRRTNKAETTRLQSHGFRFADVSNIVEKLARSMQVEREGLARRLASMRTYSRSDPIMDRGVHLGCFAIRARVGGGFDVLVRKARKNRLPAVKLPIALLDEWHVNFLRQANGWTVSACLAWLRSRTASQDLREQKCVVQLLDALTTLAADVADPLFQDAVVVSTPVQVPCRGIQATAMPGRATMLAFRTILPIHTQAMNPDLEFTPLSVFRCQQHVYRNAPDHEVFARAVHREFAPIVEPKPRARGVFHHRPSSQVIPHLTPSKNAPESKGWWVLAALERRPNGPVLAMEETEKEVPDKMNYGGIMVSQEVSIDVREINEIDGDLEMRSFGTSGCATTEMEDPDTFVDQLFGLCVEGR